MPFFCTSDFDDGSGLGVPDGGLTIDDLIYYYGLYNTGNVRADLDGGDYTLVPDGGVTVSDLLAFLDLRSNGKVSTLDDVRFAYRSSQYDPHLNLYHVRHRVLDPELGRWLQRDPAGFVDGLNLYAYTRSSPFGSWDPYGLLSDNISTEDRLRSGYIDSDYSRFAGGGRQLYRRYYYSNGEVVRSVFWEPDDASGHVEGGRYVRYGNEVHEVRSQYDADQIQINRDYGRRTSDALHILATSIDITVRTLSEGADIIISISEFVDDPTHPEVLLAVLPFVTGAMLHAASHGDEIAHVLLEITKKDGTTFRKSYRPGCYKRYNAFKDDSIIDPNYVHPGKDTRTNLQRMKDGNSPVDKNGNKIQIHHLDQSNDGPLVEMRQSDHKEVSHPKRPSEIDRPAFDPDREGYWMDRARDFE
ncbi:MAG: HNH/ENDO VII family nuclease [Phycisphaerales bacterium]